ncbi:MAG: PilX N-terminal domain-containing pilus assembly protein [Thiobacillaceae bacterium]|jgi:type IV pilus assembly protein PilX
MDKQPNSSRQSGMALVVSLIFLVLLTLIAVTAMRSTIQEEHMAGNARDHMLAFQAAEAALKAAEATLGAGTLPSGTGIYMVPNSSPAAAYTSTQDWANYNWGASAATLQTALSGIAQQPQYVIERLTTTSPGAGNQVGNAAFGPASGSGYFRITVRGTGGSANAVVMLQEIYVR